MGNQTGKLLPPSPACLAQRGIAGVISEVSGNPLYMYTMGARSLFTKTQEMTKFIVAQGVCEGLVVLEL